MCAIESLQALPQRKTIGAILSAVLEIVGCPLKASRAVRAARIAIGS